MARKDLWQKAYDVRPNMVKAKYGEGRKEISDENLILKEMK